MVRQLDDSDVQDATTQASQELAAPSDVDTQPTPSIEDILDKVTTATMQHMSTEIDTLRAQLQGQLDRRLTPVEQLKPVLELTRAQMQRLLQRTLSQEEYTDVQAEIQAELTDRAKDEKLERYEEQERRRPEPTFLQKVQSDFDRFCKPEIERAARRQGLTWEEVEPILPWRPKDGGRWQNLETFLPFAIDAVDALAEKKERDKTPAPNPATERGTGPSSALAKYRLWLDNKGPQPTSEEIDRLTAKFA